MEKKELPGCPKLLSDLARNGTLEVHTSQHYPSTDEAMAETDYVKEFQKANLHITSVIKNVAEFLVAIGLFSFVGKAYDSPQASIVSNVLLIALGSYLTASIQHYTLMIPRIGKKYYGLLFALSVAMAFGSAVALQTYLLAPTVKAIERQLATTPPAPQPQAAPSHAEIPAPPSPGTAAPKPAAAPLSGSSCHVYTLVLKATTFTPQACWGVICAIDASA